MPPILRVIHQFFVKNPRKIKKIDPDLKEMPAQQPPAVAPDIPDLTEEVVKGLKDVKYNVYVRPPPPSAPVPVTVDRLRELVVAVINANANVGPGGRLRVAASGAIEQAWDHETADPVLEAEAFAPLVASVEASSQIRMSISAMPCDSTLSMAAGRNSA